MLGDNAFLLEQLGFGHASVAQTSACTTSVIANYFANAKVGVIFRSTYAACGFVVADFANFSFRKDAAFSVQLTIRMFSSPYWMGTPPLPGVQTSCAGGGDGAVRAILKDSLLSTYGPLDICNICNLYELPRF